MGKSIHKKNKNTAVPKGFSLAGIHSGIKKSKKKDLGLIYSEVPAVACGMFTANKIQAESLKVCRQHLKHKYSRAVIVNSGNANCFTGQKGINHAVDIINASARQLSVNNRSILIASTGIIGRHLPVAKIKSAMPKLCASLNKDKADDFASSILTTDTFKKIVSLKIKIKDKTITITGFAKGAGMIYPNLKSNSMHATMLAFIITDIAIRKDLLKSALIDCVDKSFNCISLDRCMSTNDTVLTLANGVAANVPILKKDKNFSLFNAGLLKVCQQLALMIVSDAEGATKVIKISAKGAKNSSEAKKAADAVANSDLFKTAMFGGNPNWGRIVAAIGAAGLKLEQKRIEIYFNKKKILKKGKIYQLKPKDLLKKSKSIYVEIKLNRGKFDHTVFTSDLTPSYVKINADYN